MVLQEHRYQFFAESICIFYWIYSSHDSYRQMHISFEHYVKLFTVLAVRLNTEVVDSQISFL